ncbi:MAG: hypothetical protein IPO42_10725 [Chitinophagaceae bacterium]|nr:hypothetical protein [Chitinophagaceae bacterium]
MLKNVLPVFIAVLMCSVAYAQTNTASSFIDPVSSIKIITSYRSNGRF